MDLSGKKTSIGFSTNIFIQPVTISKESDLSYKRLYKLDNSILIENGRAPIIKSPNYEKIKKEIDNYKINENDIVFVHIGRYSKQKNQEMLLKTFNRLLAENHNVILLIIGSGFEQKEGLNLLSRNHNGIYFLGTQNHVGDYLLCSDCFCLTSLWEGLPISLLEALSCGTIPICTPAGGILDVISTEDYGYISIDFSEENYYALIKKYLADRSKIKQQDLVNYFNLKYSITNCAEKHLELYQSQFI